MIPESDRRGSGAQSQSRASHRHSPLNFEAFELGGWFISTVNDHEQLSSEPKRTDTTSNAAELSRKLDEAIALPEDALARVRAFLAEVSQAESERRPAPDAWSIGEIAHHLVLVTRKFAALLQIVATQLPDRFDYAGVVAKRRCALPDLAADKGVAPENVRPTAGGNIQELAQELGVAWEGGKAALRSIAGYDLSRYYWEHYRLGPLTLYEAIALQGYHALKHLAQMKRTLTQIRA